MIETGWNGKGSLWRSDDGGEQWKVVNYQHILAERPHYYTRMLVSPKNQDEVYFPNNTMVASMDGGLTARSIGWGGDDHDMWADPTDADRMMIGNDAAVMITTDHGRQWRRVTLPIAQMYHVATDNAVPYGLHGNEQDKSSTRGAGASLGGNITWQRTAGCESGFAIPDPKNPNIIWGTCYAGGVERYDVRTGVSRSVDVWPEKFLDAPAIASKYRWNWTHVVYISPHDSDTVYVGSQYLQRGLQPVREIGGAGARLCERLRLIFQEAINLVYQWQQLRRSLGGHVVRARGQLAVGAGGRFGGGRPRRGAVRVRPPAVPAGLGGAGRHRPEAGARARREGHRHP